MGLFGIWRGKRKGLQVEDLNASTPELTDNNTNNPRQAKTTGGGKFSTPVVWSGGGGGVTPPITRGTKTGNKVLSLWERRKKKWEKKKD